MARKIDETKRSSDSPIFDGDHLFTWCAPQEFPPFALEILPKRLVVRDSFAYSKAVNSDRSFLRISYLQHCGRL